MFGRTIATHDPDGEITQIFDVALSKPWRTSIAYIDLSRRDEMRITR